MSDIEARVKKIIAEQLGVLLLELLAVRLHLLLLELVGALDRLVDATLDVDRGDDDQATRFYA